MVGGAVVVALSCKTRGEEEDRNGPAVVVVVVATLGEDDETPK